MKRLTVDAKLNAYQEAIDHLRLQGNNGGETPEEGQAEYEAFQWLAEKLDRECQQWYAKLKAR